MEVAILSDLEVIEKVLAGEWRSFELLVQRYRSPLFRLGLKLLGNGAQVEDIVQDTFLKAYKNLSRFEHRSSFKSWLYQIFMNTLRNSLRGRTLLPIEDLELSHEQDIEKQYLQNELAQRLKNSIRELPPKQQMAVSLRVYEDLSFDEIAQIMACPYDTAKANYRHGLMKLKTLLKEVHNG